MKASVIEIFKRYSLALFFLIFVVLLMLLSTLGVKYLSDKMFEKTDVQMQPRGEQLKL